MIAAVRVWGAALALALAGCAGHAGRPPAPPVAVATVSPAASPAFDLRAFTAQRLAEFAREDAAAMPAPGGIVLVGSSIFNQWTDAPRQLAPLRVFNRAIGGTRTNNQLDLIETTALKYRPAIIVYYCGSNDLNGGVSPAAIAANFAAYAERVAVALPDTDIVFASINRAPQKRDRWDQVDEANRLVRAYADAHPAHLHYVDLNPAIETAPRVSRTELYQPDQLHFLPVAYEGFAAILKPVLERLAAR